MPIAASNIQNSNPLKEFNIEITEQSMNTVLLLIALNYFIKALVKARDFDKPYNISSHITNNRYVLV